MDFHKQKFDAKTVEILTQYDFVHNSIKAFCDEYDTKSSTIRRYLKALNIPYRSRLKYNIPRDNKGKFTVKGIESHLPERSRVNSTKDGGQMAPNNNITFLKSKEHIQDMYAPTDGKRKADINKRLREVFDDIKAGFN